MMVSVESLRGSVHEPSHKEQELRQDGPWNLELPRTTAMASNGGTSHSQLLFSWGTARLFSALQGGLAKLLLFQLPFVQCVQSE